MSETQSTLREYATYVNVTLEHSTGRKVPGVLDTRTAGRPYPAVLFVGTDRWTTLHRSKIERVPS